MYLFFIARVHRAVALFVTNVVMVVVLAARTVSCCPRVCDSVCRCAHGECAGELMIYSKACNWEACSCQYGTVHLSHHLRSYVPILAAPKMCCIFFIFFLCVFNSAMHCIHQPNQDPSVFSSSHIPIHLMAHIAPQDHRHHRAQISDRVADIWLNIHRFFLHYSPSFRRGVFRPTCKGSQAINLQPQY